MKLLLPLLAALAIIVVLTACKTKKVTPTKEPSTNTNEVTTTNPTDDTNEELLVNYRQGACFGTCPVYNLSIYNNGKAVYEGERFCERLGKHVAMIDRKALNELKSTLRAANLAQYPDEFPIRIPDIASQTITYYGDGEKKSVRWKDQVDKPVEEVSSAVTKFLGLDFVLAEDQEMPDYFITNELIVSLAAEADANEFVKDFSQYDLQVVKRISPQGFGGGYWLLKYDTDKIAPYEMLNLLARSKETVSVEFNKQTSSRG